MGAKAEGDLLKQDDLTKLTGLRKRGLLFETPLKSIIFEWVSHSTELQSLKLVCLVDEYNPGLLTLAEHYKLRELYLRGRLLPDNFQVFIHFFPPNLRSLTLSRS